MRRGRGRGVPAVQGLALAFALVLLVVAFTVISYANFGRNVFLTRENLSLMLLQNAVIGIMAVGMTMVILTGGIDLSVGSTLAVAGIATAVASRHGLAAAVAAPLAVGLAAGLANGLLITSFDVPPFIVTLGMMTVLRGLTYILSDAQTIFILDPRVAAIGKQWLIPIFAGVAAAGALVLRKTRQGRYLYAIGGNEEAARLSGINVDAVRCGVFSVMGLLAGLAGLCHAARLSAGDPGEGMMFELETIAAVVIGGTSLSGGRGTVPGTVLGVLIVGVLKSGMDMMGIKQHEQMVVRGVIIVAAVLLDKIVNRRRSG